MAALVWLLVAPPVLGYTGEHVADTLAEMQAEVRCSVCERTAQIVASSLRKEKKMIEKPRNPVKKGLKWTESQALEFINDWCITFQMSMGYTIAKRKGVYEYIEHTSETRHFKKGDNVAFKGAHGTIKYDVKPDDKYMFINFNDEEERTVKTTSFHRVKRLAEIEIQQTIDKICMDIVNSNELEIVSNGLAWIGSGEDLPTMKTKMEHLLCQQLTTSCNTKTEKMLTSKREKWREAKRIGKQKKNKIKFNGLKSET